VELTREQSGGAAALDRAALVYAVALAGAEVLVAAVDPRLGAVLYAVLLVLLLRHGARAATATGQRLYWSFALVPVLRLLSLSLPLGSFSGVWRYAVVATLLLLGEVVALRAEGLRLADVGLRWRWPELPRQALIGLLGVPLGLLWYVLLKPTPLAAALPPGALWVAAAVLLVSSGLPEELLFRGLLQRSSGAVLGPWLGPLLITCLWTALRLGSVSWPALGLTFLTGGLFALMAGWTGSIWGVSLANGLANVVLFLLAPYLLEPPAL
jgi:membrane protease YdiL (CAAX protease family)